jgi:chromosome segregation ATPase
LVVLAALTVVGAVLSGSLLAIAVSAGGAVLLGAAATRLVHLDLLDARVEAAHDLAVQAQGYVTITEARITENAQAVSILNARLAGQADEIADQARTIGDLEGALAAAHQRAADAMKLRAEAVRSADSWLSEAETRLEDAESRAAEAILRVHELELELDAAHAALSVESARSGVVVRRTA